MNDKVLWVTGASSGIGAAVAKKFAKEGWKVAISARRIELLDVIAKNVSTTNFDNKFLGYLVCSLQKRNAFLR